MEQHEGGEKFFDHLDMSIQQEPIIDSLIKLINSTIFERKNIVVSGKFGLFFSNYIDQEILNLIVVNGGLRSGCEIDNLEYIKDSIEDKDFIFIDDSFYSGKTRKAIKNEIERLGGRLVKTYVVYDGSLVKDDSVLSLYRYYK